MAKLSDDLILRIISRLPPKFAVRCKILSKNYNEIISTAKFGRLHALRSSNPTVFHCPAVNSRSFTRIDPLVGSDPISTALPIGISILASCNGVLLARIDCYNEYRSTSFERKVVSYVEKVQEKHHTVSSIGSGKHEKHRAPGNGDLVSRGLGPGNRENEDRGGGTSTSNGGDGGGGKDNKMQIHTNYLTQLQR